MYFPDLLKQYKQLLKQMKSEGVTSGEMYREVQQAIQWMETGYDPAEYRAATRVDAYPMDPYNMQTYVSYLNSDDEMLLPDFLQTIKSDIVSRWIPDETDQLRADEFISRHFKSISWAASKASEAKYEILGALRGLSDNEKAAFVAVRAEKMAFSKVATMLGVSKSAVQCYVARAEKKIKRNIEQQKTNDMAI